MRITSSMSKPGVPTRSAFAPVRQPPPDGAVVSIRPNATCGPENRTANTAAVTMGCQHDVDSFFMGFAENALE
jgi:hypothetical protein